MSKPDAELIVLSQQGDETAFAQLVQRYQNKVYTLAVHLLGDREEGRDAAQEVFIRVYNALPRFRKEADFLPWLYTITANIVRDRWRRQQREKGTIRVSLDEMTVELADHRFTPESVLVKDVRLMVERLWPHFLGLPNTNLCGIPMVSYEGLPILPIPLNTVKLESAGGACCSRIFWLQCWSKGGTVDDR